MSTRSAELHRPGATVYRCGPCRRGRHGRCTTARPCGCSETPECTGSVDLDHAEQTLRRLQAEQAERAAAEPATPPPTPARKVNGREPTLRDRILMHLVDHGPVEDPDGHATVKLVDAIGHQLASTQTTLGTLDRLGLIQREKPHHASTTRISITAAGREAVGSSPGASGADEKTPTPPASVQPVGRDNPAGAVSEAPGDQPRSGSSGGQGPSPAAVEAPLGVSAVPSPEVPVADVELELLAERLRRRLRRALVLAVEPFVDAHRDEAWFERLFELFDLAEPES